MFTNDSLTIFNRHTTSNKNVLYIPHKIDNVFWDSIESVSEGTEADKKDEVVAYIPYDKNDFSRYVEPKQYDSSLENIWTIKEGDFIVRGDITNVGNIETIKTLKDYEVFTIYFVDVNDFGSSNMQHIKIKGK